MRRRRTSTNVRHILRPALRLIVWPVQGLAPALFWWCCAAMTPERAARFGAGVGRALGPHFRWHRRVCDNLAIALPDASSEELAAITRGV